MGRYKYTLGGFSAGDFKAVEQELNRQAAAGWELVHAGPVLAKWRRTDRSDLRWCVDLASPRQDREVRKDYLALCTEGGWELADFTGGMYLFRSRPGEETFPVQTDPVLEKKHYNWYYLLNCVLSVIVILVWIAFYALLFWGMEGSWAELAEILRTGWQKSWALAGLSAAAPLWGLCALWRLVDFFVSLWRGRGGAIPVPPRLVMAANGLTCALYLLGAVLVVVGAALDSVLGGGRSVPLLVALGLWACLCLYRGFLQYEDDLFPGERRRARTLGLVLLGLLALLLVCRAAAPFGSWSDYWDESEGIAHYEALDDDPVIKLETLGFDRSERNYRRVTEAATPMGRVWQVEDYEGVWAMGCESTVCYTKGQAEWLLSERRGAAEKSAGGSEYFPMPGLELGAIALPGADEAWYGEYSHGDAQFSVLLLRAGRLVCRVIAPAGLDGAQLAVIFGELARF